MKHLIFLLCILAGPAFAAAPSTECPKTMLGYYIAITEPYITIATSCPSGTTAVGTAESCLVSYPDGVCIMYAPVGMSFTDDTGTYEFTEPCTMN